MKIADREHRCTALHKDHPRFMIMRNIDCKEWDVWIPDFLRTDDTTVRAFVWRISFCPFCGCDLFDEKNSKETN